LDARRGQPGYRPANYDGPGSGSENPFIFADIARSLKFGHAAPDLPANIKAITSSSGSAVVQDPTLADDIIYALMANNELVEAGASIVNIENYRQVPKVTTYPAAVWQNGEGTEITVDASLAIGSVKWTLADMAIRVRVSNQFLMDTSERGRRLVQESMRKAVQDELARAALVGTGATGQPAGIEQFSGLQTTAAAGALGDWTHIIGSVKKLLSVNVPLPNISFIGSPEVWRQMASFEATDGQPLRMPPLLEPIRFMSPTSLVPENYSGTDTAAFVADFSRLIIGIQGSFEFVLDQTRAHHLETEFLIHLRADVQATHEDAFCQITGITVA
jgi:HK97 family phage major capsid protein